MIVIMRRTKRTVRVGNVAVGGDAPVSIQSMTNTNTSDIEATIAQVESLAEAGAEIVRVAVPTRKDTAALPNILASATVPIVADVHFHFERAMEAIEAGVAKIRLNPGNLRDREKLIKVIDAAKAAEIPIRIGVNAGSIRTKSQLTEKFSDEHLLKLIFDELDQYVRFFRDRNFENLVLSAKSSDVMTTVALYRELSKRYDFPSHLGLTHAGTLKTGAIRSASAMGILLAEGIGDTIRVSLSGDPVEEIYVARQILSDLRLRSFSSPELTACPTCGRCEIDLPKVASDIEEELRKIDKPIKVAIMGCIVNGPGEAADANVALVAGKDCGFIYVDGERKSRIKPGEMIEKILQAVREY